MFHPNASTKSYHPSSVKTSKELPFLMQLGKNIGAHKFFGFINPKTHAASHG